MTRYSARSHELAEQLRAKALHNLGHFDNQCQAIDSNREQCAYTTHAGAHTFELTAAEASAWQTMDGLPSAERKQLAQRLESK